MWEKREKQIDSVKITIPEMKLMGRVSDENGKVYLFESFLEKLIRSMGLNVENVSSWKNRSTEVDCPFCKKGILKLVRIVPRATGGPRQYPPEMLQLGYVYTFECSKCRRRFIGSLCK